MGDGHGPCPKAYDETLEEDFKPLGSSSLGSKRGPSLGEHAKGSFIGDQLLST